jgi:hypothetical protein
LDISGLKRSRYGGADGKGCRDGGEELRGDSCGVWTRIQWLGSLLNKELKLYEKGLLSKEKILELPNVLRSVDDGERGSHCGMTASYVAIIP